MNTIVAALIGLGLIAIQAAFALHYIQQWNPNQETCECHALPNNGTPFTTPTPQASNVTPTQDPQCLLLNVSTPITNLTVNCTILPRGI